MDVQALEGLRLRHPSWRLLRADNAPLIIGFLHRTFVAPNKRTLAQPELVSKLDDLLFHLRRERGEGTYPKPAASYLDDWASDQSAFLRKYYPADADEPHYDITPSTEKVISWIGALGKRQFVGTQSRLLAVFEEMRRLIEGTDADAGSRMAELLRRRAEIDAEIARIRGGDVPVLDATSAKERFQHAMTMARALLSDFREVEQNFRDLDRMVRERIAQFDGDKGQLLGEIFGERDMIVESDEGRSFRAFWEFLMSPSRQEELTALLTKAFALEAVQELEPDRRLLRIHFDWLDAGEVAQRTVARLSEQLRRYIDDKAFLENRRIMQILRDLEGHALAVREAPPQGPFMEIGDSAPEIRLPFERPLFRSPVSRSIAAEIETAGSEPIPADALFGHTFVDKSRLKALIRKTLQTRPQVSLADLVAAAPLEQGLAEVVAYMSLAADDAHAVIDDRHKQTLIWTDADNVRRQATLPLVIFARPAAVPALPLDRSPEP